MQSNCDVIFMFYYAVTFYNIYNVKDFNKWMKNKINTY